MFQSNNNQLSPISPAPLSYCWGLNQNLTGLNTVDPLVVVVVLVVVAGVPLGGGVGEEAVGRGVEQTGPLLGHQQGWCVMHAAAFLHIVHLQQAGKHTG